jgi:hypothetical protein
MSPRYRCSHVFRWRGCTRKVGSFACRSLVILKQVQDDEDEGPRNEDEGQYDEDEGQDDEDEGQDDEDEGQNDDEKRERHPELVSG